jgi:FixJ family two-component response regulator
MAVEAIRNGALDFIEKPFRGDAVVARVKESIAAWSRRGEPAHQPAMSVQSREPLTSREQDVLARIVAGASNKEAGRELGISPRTIEFHRARIIEKVGAKNTADLIRIVMSRQSANGAASAGLESAGPVGRSHG